MGSQVPLLISHLTYISWWIGTVESTWEQKAFVLQKDVSNKPQLIWKSLFWQCISDLKMLKKRDVIKFTSERPVHGLVMGEWNARTMSPSILLINLNWGLVRSTAFSTPKPPVSWSFCNHCFSPSHNTCNLIFHLPFFLELHDELEEPHQLSTYVLLSFRNNEPLQVKNMSLVSLKSPKL